MCPVALGLLFIALCVGVVALSEAFQHCISAIPDQGGAQNPKDRIASLSALLSRQWGCTGEFVHANGEAIIAAFTVILAMSTIALWNATRNLVRSAEHAAEQQLRAYLSVDNAIIKNTSGASPNLIIEIKNCGKTPAYNVTHTSNVDALEAGEEFFDLEEAPVSQGDIGPSQTRRINKILHPPHFDEMRPALQSKLKTLYLYGEIRYRDAFDSESRWVKYRLSFLVDDDGIRDRSLVICSEGNKSN